MEDEDKSFSRKVSRWWLVLLASLLIAALSFYNEWAVPLCVSLAVAMVAFIVIDWLNSSGDGGFTPTSYGAC